MCEGLLSGNGALYPPKRKNPLWPINLKEVDLGFRETGHTTLPTLALQLCKVFLPQKACFSQIPATAAHCWLVRLHAIITGEMLL